MIERNDGCAICDGERVVSTIQKCQVVAPPDATCDLDLWIAPEEHVETSSALTPSGMESWLATTKAVAERWRANAGCEGMHGMGCIGSGHSDWPAHLALRVIGRRSNEVNNPMRLFNGREERADVDGILRANALAAPVGDLPAPTRWHLSEDALVSECLSCDPSAIEHREVAVTGTTRLYQHSAAIAEGMLVASPVRHVERVEDLQAGEFEGLLGMFEAANDLFLRQVGADRTYFSFNDGPVAGQETPHLHVHLWARLPGEPANPFASGLPKMMGRPDGSLIARLRDQARHAFRPPVDLQSGCSPRTSASER
jgi:diadenosine tetraphosphate (Ap4A) HIT family hydrolase